MRRSRRYVRHSVFMPMDRAHLAKRKNTATYRSCGDRLAGTRPKSALNLEVLSRSFAPVRDFLVFDDLPLIETAEAGSFDRRDVDEQRLGPTRCMRLCPRGGQPWRASPHRQQCLDRMGYCAGVDLEPTAVYGRNCAPHVCRMVPGTIFAPRRENRGGAATELCKSIGSAIAEIAR